MAAKILYVNTFPDCRIEAMTLSGIRRYAAARGWPVETAGAADVVPRKFPALLRTLRPAGCIVECSGGDEPFDTGRLGDIPVVLCNCTAAGCGTRVAVDDAAVAKAAFRELSAGRPPAYAVVASRHRRVWSTLRMEAFRAEVVAAGGECFSFGGGPRNEPPDSRARRLADWVAALPRRCAIFAVHDETADEVVAAAKATYRHIPRELTLLGVDNDTSICETSRPTVSSIQIDFERMGFLAAKMLGGNISHRGTETQCLGKHADLLTPNDVREEVSRVNGEQIRVINKKLCGSVALCNKCFTVGPLLAVRRDSTRGAGRREPHILEAVETIRREACNGLTAADLAKRFPGSRRHFDRRFREAVGHSPLDEILHVRLEKAFTLLADTDTAIGAIYAHCGFRSPRALDFLVRDRTGMSMREWRKRNARKRTR